MSNTTGSMIETESLDAVELSASLTVRDVQASLDWYRDVLGFALARKFERDDRLQAASLRAGSVRVLLTQDDGAKGWDRAKGEGMSLMLTTDQDIDGVATRIKQSGWTLDTEPVDMPHGARAFRLKDPDGFKLTFSSQ
ncbi:MAG: hypothetical protein GEU90_13610 [Gemmatimonas sp.]|nr:hypothetical protein [Gemmatimonas sp.]